MTAPIHELDDVYANEKGWWAVCACGHVAGPDDDRERVGYWLEMHAVQVEREVSAARQAATNERKPIMAEEYDEGLAEDERPLGDSDEFPTEPMLEGTDGVDVTVVGINGEWLPDDLDLGDSVKLEVYATVIAVGEKLRGGDKSKPVKRFVKLDVNGVEVV